MSLLASSVRLDDVVLRVVSSQTMFRTLALCLWSGLSSTVDQWICTEHVVPPLFLERFY